MKQSFFVQFSALDTSTKGIQVATATVFGLWPDPLLPREEVDKPSSAAGAAAVFKPLVTIALTNNCDKFEGTRKAACDP